MINCYQRRKCHRTEVTLYIYSLSLSLRTTFPISSVPFPSYTYDNVVSPSPLPRCLRQLFGKHPPSALHRSFTPSVFSRVTHTALESRRRYRTTLRRESYRASFVIYLSLIFFIRRERLCEREREKGNESTMRVLVVSMIHTICTTSRHTCMYKHAHNKNIHTHTHIHIK